MDKVWFRKKRVGFGLRPSGVTGWLVTAIAVLALLLDRYLYHTAVIPSRSLFLVAGGAVLAVFATLVVTHKE